MKYKIISTLNSGAEGMVYKIKLNNKYYALRRQKISDQDAIDMENNFKNNNLLEMTNEDKI